MATKRKLGEALPNRAEKNNQPQAVQRIMDTELTPEELRIQQLEAQLAAANPRYRANVAKTTKKNKVYHSQDYFQAKEQLKRAQLYDKAERKRMSELNFNASLAGFKQSRYYDEVISSYRAKHGTSPVESDQKTMRGLMLRAKLLESGKANMGGGGAARKAQNLRYRQQAAVILGISPDNVTRGISSFMANDPRAAEKLQKYVSMSRIFRGPKAAGIKKFTRRQLAKAQQL
jgi:hypothetical protein